MSNPTPEPAPNATPVSAPDAGPVSTPVAAPDPMLTGQRLARLLPYALVLLFGAGVLLVYVVNPPHRTPDAPAAASPATPKPTAPANDLAAARQRIADLEASITGLQARLRAYAALGARLSEQGVLITLGEPELQFAPGKVALPTPLPAGLTHVAALLTQEPRPQVLIEAHTDSKGSAATNLTLSVQRAAAVKAALVKLGGTAERIQVRGIGAARPVTDNRTPEGRSRNRRIEVYLTEP